MRNFFEKFLAFLRKDIKIAISYKFNLLLQFLAIVFFLLLFSFSMDSIDVSATENSPQTQYSEFFRVLIGIALIDFMFSSMSVFSREVRLAQNHGTFEALILTNTSILTILISSYALSFTKSFLRIIMYILIGVFIFGVDISFSNIPIFLFIVIYNALPYVGIGLFAASFIIIFKVGNIINLFTGLFSIFFSGIFFQLDSFSNEIINISDNLPLAISLELSQEVLLDNFSFNKFIPELLKVFYLILIFLPSSIFLVYHSLKIAKKNGSLNYY
ncbi:MAG: hypothetical protein CMD75_04145 [Gammaproteobacteria bacterium]|nr:hypothetical protein [Gammaproteobacteria bacterium]|tara:strand:- start:25 stop:840 length:816 start_codon:yes stop_codon:yes gene_type:complete